MPNMFHRRIFILTTVVIFILNEHSATDALSLNFFNLKSQSVSPSTDPSNTLNVDDSDDLFIEKQLATARCPAKIGKELNDYWKCLWGTSITVQGMEKHRQLKAENVAKHSEQNHWKTDFNRNRKKNSLTKKERILRRVKRNTVTKDTILYRRSYTIIRDIETTFKSSESVEKCQHATIEPGRSLVGFIECLRVNSKNKNSLNSTLDLEEDPPLDNSFDPNEFRILTDEQTGLHFGKSGLKFDFYYIGETGNYKEESSFNFNGGDPYLSEQGSEYRYKFDNLRPGDLPGWSYSGLHSPSKWHTLDPKKFFVPISQAADLQKLVTVSDFAQTYPGLGEIASVLSNLEVPFDFRWTKDYGFHAYTRFLIPLLSKSDLQYYKSKNYIPGDIYFRHDRDQVQDIIDALIKFESDTNEHLIRYNIPNTNYRKESDVPLYEVYVDFLHHYFRVELTEYKEWKKSVLKSKEKDQVYFELEQARRILRAYVQAVKAQLVCTKELVETYDERRDDTDFNEIVDHALGACSGIRAPSPPVGDKKNNRYHVSKATIENLYHSYFNRKEARRRYTLPVYPFQYPICQHNEQSPQNIITLNAIKSSLRNYYFGESAYYLQKMYMKYSFDGSNTITVGIVGGERMDGSAPKLSGGALKGVNLTFQQFNVRFSHDWKKQGSEHSFDGVAAPMELQFLFTVAGSADRLKYWHILAQVQNQVYQYREKLILMIAILVDVVETDEELIKKCKETGQDPFLFEPISQTVYHLRKRVEQYPTYDEPRSYVSKDPIFRLIDFIPKRKSYYYTYRGSLSWPPCFGYVLWSVFEERLLISKRQFSEFAKIPSFATSNNNYASDNIRKPGDIHVADEQNPKLTYKERRRLVDLRTIERVVLEGIHDPSTLQDDVFDDEVYTIGGDDDISEASSLNRRVLSRWCVLLANMLILIINLNIVKCK